MSLPENKDPKPQRMDVKHSLMLGNELNMSNYSFFSQSDDSSWNFYCIQQVQMWLSGEIPYSKDLDCFRNLPPRQKQVIEEILGFFSPADGLVSASIVRQLQSATTSIEVGFLFFQGAIESVHNEVYSLFIKMFASDPKDELRIFNMVRDIPCVGRKAAFIQKYIDSDIHVSLRCLAQACAEGIFFVTLFSVIFFFRKLGLLEAFVFANEQISKDETLHRDFFCAKAEEKGLREYMPAALEIIEEAVQIEEEYIRYLLREPIQSRELDDATGITVDNLVQLSQLLADQILVNCGAAVRYGASPNLPWMSDIGLQKKNNFYEKRVGSYKKGSLVNQLDWRRNITPKEPLQREDCVLDCGSIDF